MPKRKPTDGPGAIHHVMFRGVDGRALFEHDTERVTLLDHLDEILAEGEMSLLWWALMTNHGHLLLRTLGGSLAALMHRLVGAYARGFNVRRERIGHVVQARYRAVPVSDERHAKAEIRYLTLNPVAAGLVELERVHLYPWTAYASFSGARSGPPRLDESFVTRLFASDLDGARRALRHLVLSTGRTPVRSGAELALREEAQTAYLQHGISPELFWRGRAPDLMAARRELAVFAIGPLGFTAATAAATLGVHPATVRRALRRSEPGSLAAAALDARDARSPWP
jgi:REP element-mobilizing transposase RayT